MTGKWTISIRTNSLSMTSMRTTCTFIYIWNNGKWRKLRTRTAKIPLLSTNRWRIINQIDVGTNIHLKCLWSEFFISKNAGCATRIHHKVNKQTFSDRIVYYYELSTANRQFCASTEQTSVVLSLFYNTLAISQTTQHIAHFCLDAIKYTKVVVELCTVII